MTQQHILGFVISLKNYYYFFNHVYNYLVTKVIMWLQRTSWFFNYSQYDNFFNFLVIYVFLIFVLIYSNDLKLGIQKYHLILQLIVTQFLMMMMWHAMC
jgi:hypothetical protein